MVSRPTLRRPAGGPTEVVSQPIAEAAHQPTAEAPADRALSWSPDQATGVSRRWATLRCPKQAGRDADATKVSMARTEGRSLWRHCNVSTSAACRCF